MKTLALHPAILLSMFLLIVAAPGSAGGQACGYSINTIYITDRGSGFQTIDV